MNDVKRQWGWGPKRVSVRIVPKEARVIAVLALLALLGSMWTVVALSEPSSESLLRNFIVPPAAAKPPVPVRAASVTETRAEYRWMGKIGLASADCARRLPAVSSDFDGRDMSYMSLDWRRAIRYSAMATAACGVEGFIGTEPGYGGIGGPSVEPHAAMKKFVWSKTVLQGGQIFRGHLTSPPRTTGPFQDVRYTHFSWDADIGVLPEFYADAAVVAYRAAGGDHVAPAVVLTSSQGAIDGRRLADGNLETGVELSVAQQTPWIEFHYDQPQTIRTAVLGVASSVVSIGDYFPELMADLEVKDSAGEYRSVAMLTVLYLPEVTVSFPPVTGKTFRFTFHKLKQPILPPYTPPPGLNAASYMALAYPATGDSIFISELSLETDGRVNEFERKAGFTPWDDYYALDTLKEADNDPISASSVLDLTRLMNKEGVIEWAVPPGRWVVLRVGYSLLGVLNHPVPADATGLEVDKLNRGFVKEYMDGYLDAFSSITGAAGIRGVFMDSIESGPQNWTDDILDQFQKLRGYDPRPWLPTLTGTIIENAHASDHFLWDFRRTLADLLSTSLYAEIARSTHAHALVNYSEALELDRPLLGDDMDMRRYADVPMGAMWSYRTEQGPFVPYEFDQRGAASVAHVYGRSQVMGESFTNILDPWAYAPRDLKPIADLEFSLGINRLMGIGIDRLNTVADDVGPWVSYLVRSSFLLQQGQFVADVAYFYGEEAPLTGLAWSGQLKDLPSQGYAFDFVNAATLLQELRVENGEIVTTSGMHYRILQLGGASERMTVPVLRKIKTLVEHGAVIVGARPTATPSLVDDTEEFRSLTESLWGNGDKVHDFGKGRVYTRSDVDSVLAALNVPPDMACTDPQACRSLAFVHRASGNTDLYFLSNQSNQNVTSNIVFRVGGKRPEVWDAETGAISLPACKMHDGNTVVSLHLEPWGSTFVVMRRATSDGQCAAAESNEIERMSLGGPWKIAFQPNRGAPRSLTLNALASWSESAIEGVKYFSGTAIYNKIIHVPRRWLYPRSQIQIDLGDVREIAGIELNGQKFPVKWHPPYRFDVTSAVRAGSNTLRVRVVNLWVNRMIGDAQSDGKGRFARTVDHSFSLSEDLKSTSHAYVAAAPLRPSGLLGPVVIIHMIRQSSAKARRLAMHIAGPQPGFVTAHGPTAAIVQ